MIPVRLIVAASIAAGLFATGWVGGYRWVKSDWDAEKAEAARQAVQASEEARKLDNKRASVAQEVQTGYAKKQESLSRSNAVAAVELDRVRNQLDTISRAASGAEAAERANAERVRVLAGLLQESAGLSEEGRRRVEALDARLSGLQEWAEGVCLTGVAQAK